MCRQRVGTDERGSVRAAPYHGRRGTVVEERAATVSVAGAGADPGGGGGPTISFR